MLDDGIKTRISEAIAHVDSLDNDVDLEVFNFTNYGKEFIKSSGEIWGKSRKHLWYCPENMAPRSLVLREALSQAT